MPKQKVTVTLDQTILDWLSGQVKMGRFRNRSHGIEFAVNKLKEMKE